MTWWLKITILKNIGMKYDVYDLVVKNNHLEK
jgi:hypothetical protein